MTNRSTPAAQESFAKFLAGKEKWQKIPLSAGKGVLVPLLLDHEQRSSQSARGMIAVKRPNEEHGKETAKSNLVIQRHGGMLIAGLKGPSEKEVGKVTQLLASE